MNEATIKAMIAYLEALKAEGLKFVHLGSIIPMHTMSNLERKRSDLPTWTQFPVLPVLPEGMAYDRSSGFVYFDMDLYAQVEPR